MSAALPRMRQALWMAELQTEQAVPSMTADGSPGQPTGRDASKDGSRDGPINTGPWNDNVAMLSK